MLYKPKIITNSSSTAFLRDDFYSKHFKLINQILQEANADIFCHTLSYQDKEHSYESEFLNHPEWQNTYWTKYWNKNPLTSPLTTAARKNGFAFVTCETFDPDSECMEVRHQMCQTKYSTALVLYHPGADMVENIAFGFKKFHPSDFNFSIFNKISKTLHPLREDHRMLIKEPHIN